LLKGKRASFFKGAGWGGIIGFGAGYLAGNASYSDDFNRATEENDDRRRNRAMLFGAIGAVLWGWGWFNWKYSYSKTI
jgi:hypothetical protein